MNHEQIKKILLESQGFKKEYENEFDISFEVAKYIRQLRIKYGLTQAKLAKLVKTKQASIARIENPGSPMPSLRFLKKIAKAFKTELIPPKFLELEKEKNETNNKAMGIKICWVRSDIKSDIFEDISKQESRQTNFDLTSKNTNINKINN